MESLPLRLLEEREMLKHLKEIDDHSFVMQRDFCVKAEKQELSYEDITHCRRMIHVIAGTILHAESWKSYNSSSSECESIDLFTFRCDIRSRIFRRWIKEAHGRGWDFDQDEPMPFIPTLPVSGIKPGCLSCA